MQTPPHSSSEIAGFLSRGVERLERLGIDRDCAVAAVAAEHGVAGKRVADLLHAHGHTGDETRGVLA